MTARRSSSDPVSRYLETGERIVWRHQPDPRALFYNRLPSVIIVLIMTAFIVGVGWNFFGREPWGPVVLDAWLIIPAAFALFFLVLLYFFLSTLWNHTRYMLESWSTYYALTDRRFIVVSGRGMVEYDAAYFHRMESLGGEPGTQVLAFDWRMGRKRREYFHDRIAGLPDAAKLERLIRDTLRA